MTELIIDLDYRIVDDEGTEYYVSVAGEMGPDGRWEGWLEFVPLNDSDVLLTPTETHQATRAALAHWSTTVTEVYVQGAFARAIPAGVNPRVVARAVAAIAAAEPPAIDPFELIRNGKSVLRAALRPLSRAELLAIISRYGLNPAAKSLAWLSDSQLITFIVTAVEVQQLHHSR